MSYNFYIDGERLPVTPSKLMTKIRNGNKTITLLDGNEINLLKAPGLTEIQFNALFPAVRHPFASYTNGFKSPKTYLDKLEKLKTGKKPFQFIVTREKPNGKGVFDTNITVSLEDYTITEEAGNGLDISVEIKLKQYRAYGTKKVKVDGKTATEEKTRASSLKGTGTKEQTYTVKSGDCLWTIAKKFYGNGERWRTIYDANKKTIGGNPDLIYPGQKLAIPAED